MGTQTETRTPRATDLGGGGPLGVPQGLQRGGERGERAVASQVGVSGRPFPGSGLMEVPLQRGEGRGRRGSATPPPPAPAAPATVRWDAVPQRPPPPLSALPQSPSSRSRRAGAAPSPPFPALRLAQLGDDGRGLARARRVEEILLSSYCLCFSQPATLVPLTGAPGLRDPFGEAVPSSPGEDAWG